MEKGEGTRGREKGSCSDTGHSGKVSLLNLYHKLDESNDILKGGNLARIITVVHLGRRSPGQRLKPTEAERGVLNLTLPYLPSCNQRHPSSLTFFPPSAICIHK